MRSIKPKILSICFLALFVAACKPSWVEVTGDPSAGAAKWTGDWQVWVIKSTEPEPKKTRFHAGGDIVAGEVEIVDGIHAIFEVEVGADGMYALGTYKSDEGLIGSVSFIQSAEGNQFSGHLHGIAAICGAREGFDKPDPCLSSFGSGWDGSWTVWLGASEMQSSLYFDPLEGSVGPLNYEVDLKTSADGSTLSGTWQSVGSTGRMEAFLQENGVQFVGNMDGIFAFCGVRPGGPRPEDCMKLE